ncbi:MAG: TOBE domain-containing protein [Solirubrobacterales bacterium]
MDGERPGLSARNRFRGTVRSIDVDGVMALVEIESGEHRVTAAITRSAIEDMGLEVGDEATALVKATSVIVMRGHHG